MDRHLPDDLRLHLDAELAALRKLEGAQGVAPDHLRFCGEIARFQAGGRSAIRSARPPLSDTSDGLATDMPEQRLSRESIQLDRVILRNLLSELQAIVRIAPPDDNQLQLLAAASDAEPELLEELTAASAACPAQPGCLDDLGARIGVSPAALALVGRLLVSPFVTEARQRRGPLPELDARQADAAEAARCPTCAAAPAMAVLGHEDGRRRLFCSLCGETWIVPRLMCACCGTRDPVGLATLHLSEEDPRWIETCDSCGHYIKAIDLERLPAHHVLMAHAEAAATVLLDVLAEEAGYLPPAC